MKNSGRLSRHKNHKITRYQPLSKMDERKYPSKKINTLVSSKINSSLTLDQIENEMKFPNGVIIDEEIGTGSYWSLLYPSKKLKFWELEDAENFFIVSHKWKKNTRIFVALNSSNKTKPRHTVDRLLQHGFKNIVIVGSETKYCAKRFIGFDLSERNDPELELLT